MSSPTTDVKERLSETCQRYLSKSGMCGKPVFTGFIMKSWNNNNVRVALCEKHSADEGVRRVK